MGKEVERSHHVKSLNQLPLLLIRSLCFSATVADLNTWFTEHPVAKLVCWATLGSAFYYAVSHAGVLLYFYSQQSLEIDMIPAGMSDVWVHRLLLVLIAWVAKLLDWAAGNGDNLAFLLLHLVFKGCLIWILQ